MRNSQLRVTFISVLMCVLSACQGHKSDVAKSLEADIVPGSAAESMAEPDNCEVPGQGFGIVGGVPLSSGNILSESTVIVVHANSKTEKESICTGTLIDKNKVLTAAHCVEKDGAGKTIIAFTNNLACASKALNRTVREVLTQVEHPDYVYGELPIQNASSDFALLKFAGEFPAGYKARELPEKTYVMKPTAELILSGYGKSAEFEGETIGTLRFLKVPQERLSDKYFSLREKRWIEPKALVLDQSQNGVCGGDSGGPLYAYDQGRLVLIGITSAGIDHRTTALDQAPKVCSGIALFSSVTEKLEWIQKTSAEL